MFQQRRSVDELNRFLLITALVASVAGMFFEFGSAVRYVLTAITAFCLVFGAIRLLSKNTQRRYQENMKYLTLTTGVRTFFRDLIGRVRGAFGGAGSDRAHRAHKARRNPTWSEIKQYKYFVCPQCTQRLRVPRGKGRIRVTCTRCGNVFDTKS